MKEEKLKKMMSLVYLVIALFALRWTVVEPYVVPTGSMEPTLKKGDRLYALKCAYDIRFPFTDWILFRTGSVKRGDVILFKAPPFPSLTYVKRAVALPGDKIDYVDGKLFVNGQEVPRTEAPDRSILYDVDPQNHETLFVENQDGVKHYTLLTNRSEFERQLQESEMRYRTERVPEGYVFAMGDHRDNSNDSRYWGFVPMENLKGKAMFIWYSSPPVITGDRPWNKVWDMIAGWFDPRPERVGTLIN